ncbi:MAG: helix-turn-helix transcriptional regulator [Rhodospirillales bacterium]|nr:helix-turn-helix transcriptional regulator [Rhodospirillales bacterium]
MKMTRFAGWNCTVARSLDVIGEWWTMLIIREAFLGTRRFADFQANLGIARNVLTVRLRRLVERGILEKRRYQDRPPRAEYRLTAKGRDLLPVLVALMEWGDRWESLPAGPSVVLRDRATGAPVQPALTDRRSGRPIDTASVLAAPGPGADPALRARLTAWAKDCEARRSPAAGG